MFGWLRFGERRKARSPAELVADAARDAGGGSTIQGIDRRFADAEAENAQRLIEFVGGIPGYRITRLIRAGVQGIVFEGVQLSTGRRVAIKTLNASRGDPDADARTQARFEREIRALAELNDPGIVTIYDSGATPTQRYFAMEFVDGVDLLTHLASRGGDRRELLRVMHAIAASLHAAHQKGIVHRDLKPSNIMIEPSGRVRILDFGLAKLETPDSTQAQLSEEGRFYGTRRWAAPEQIRGAASEISPATDIYALGVMLYCALTGGFPYPVDESSAALSRHILESSPEPMRRIRRDVPRDLESIVQQCLRKKAAARYPHAGALADDLKRYAEGAPVRARGDGWWYRSRLQLRRAWRDGTVLVVCLAPVIGFLPGYAIYSTNWLDRIRDPFVARTLQSRAVWHPDVKVIALTDESIAQIEQLATKWDVAGVHHDKLYSWRAMHGRMMERIALAAPKALIWAIHFEIDAPEFDDRFVTGMRALQAVGTRVALSASKVVLPYSPKVASKLWAAADDWGWISCPRLLQRDYLSYMAALVDRPHMPQQPGIPLAAYRACIQNPGDQQFRWQTFWTSIFRDAPINGKPETVEIIPFMTAGEIPIGPNDDSAAVAPRWAAYFEFALPPAADYQSQTYEYHRVFEMSDADLTAAFAGKAVLVGDCRRLTSPSPDLVPWLATGGTRAEFGVFAVGSALSHLLHGRMTMEVEWGGLAVLSAAAAVLGTIAVIAALAIRRVAIKLLVIGATFVAIAPIGLVVLLQFNRIIPLCSMLVAWAVAFGTGGLLALLRKSRRPELVD